MSQLLANILQLQDVQTVHPILRISIYTLFQIYCYSIDIRSALPSKSNPETHLIALTNALIMFFASKLTAM